MFWLPVYCLLRKIISFKARYDICAERDDLCADREQNRKMAELLPLKENPFTIKF